MELLRDRSTELEEAGVRAFGISRDSPWTHIAWKQALDLDFPLLSDWNGQASEGFGVAREFRGMRGRAAARGLSDRAGRYGPGPMAVRRLRAPRLRRVDPGRAGFVALACALYLAAAVVATWPAIQHADSRFLGHFHRSGHGHVVPGDYLQANYHLWLVGHQLENGNAPWIDPYSFQPETTPRLNFGGWPFGLPYWPAEAAFGPVVAWNLLILFSYVAAGLSRSRGCGSSGWDGVRRSSAVSRSRSGRIEWRRARGISADRSRSSCLLRSSHSSGR